MSLVFLTEAEECQLHAAPAIVASKPELVSMPMRGYQRQASDAVFKAWGDGNRYALIQLATGLGKCLGKGQTVLKHSGEIVTVESIRAGDLLMGPDSRPRTVVGVASGYGPMRRIVPVKGEEWRCNDVHVLTTVNSATGEVSDTPLDVFQTEKTRDFRRLAKQFSVKVDFPASEPLGISPYFLGIWLGDGDHSLRRGVHISKNDIEVEEACSAVAAQHGCVSRAVQGRTCKSYFIAGARVGGKRQPNGVMAMIRRYVGPGMEVSPAVLTASRAERLEFLAGLMDTDGHASAGCFDFVQKNRNIFDAVVFCARSVGLKVTTTTKTVPGYGLYYRCCISGDCAMVPTRIPRKRIAERKQIKDALRTGFSIAEDGYGEWFGFELDGDGRFLLGDFTVTHNTRVAGDICQRIKGRVLFLCQLEVLLQNALHALEGITGEWVGVERGPSRAGGERIIVGTVQTVSRRLRKFRRDSFEAIVVDELQHVRGEQYQRVLDWFQCPALGMTATPVDGMGFGYPVFSMSLAEGSREGWLAPVAGERVDIGKVDLRSVRREGEDFEAKSLDLEMVKGATGIADVILERHSKDKGIAFFPGRKSARLFADVINGKRPGMCVYIDAHIKGEDRAALMRKLATGEARWLSNVGIACLDSETEILSQSGWVGIESTTMEHSLANWYPDGRIEFSCPLAIERRNRRMGEPMLRIRQRMMDMRVTGDHRVPHLVGGTLVVDKAKELEGAEIEIPICGSAKPLCINIDSEPRGDRRLRINSLAYLNRKRGMPPGLARECAAEAIDCRDSMSYTQPSELTRNDCWLIGYWLGDGNTQSLASGGQSLCLHNEQSLSKLNAWIESVLRGCGMDSIKKTIGSAFYWFVGRGTGFGTQKKEGFFRLEKYLDKSGSGLLWALTAEQIRWIMEGFWMADGDHGDAAQPLPGTLRISNCNLELLSKLQAVVVCRGMSCRISVRGNGDRYGQSSPLGHISVSSRKTHMASPRHSLITEPEHASERVWCVKVESSFIVARRNGKVFVTGNTEGFDWPEASVIAMCHPTTSKTLYMQKVGRGTRPCGVDLRDEVSAEHRRAQIDLSAKPCMRILDFLGASEGETLELASFDTMDFSVRPHIDIGDEQVRLPDKREDAERPETIAKALPRRRGLSVKSSTKYSTWEFDPMHGSCSDELKEKIDAFERGGTDAVRRV